MKSPDTQPAGERRVEDPQQAGEHRTADATPTARAVTHFVDPYDLRAEPQLEEPGYGHGV